MLGE
jgi:hypothetical protein